MRTMPLMVERNTVTGMKHHSIWYWGGGCLRGTNRLVTASGALRGVPILVVAHRCWPPQRVGLAVRWQCGSWR
jgi:hypothetical protein